MTHSFVVSIEEFESTQLVKVLLAAMLSCSLSPLRDSQAHLSFLLICIGAGNSVTTLADFQIYSASTEIDVSTATKMGLFGD